MREIQCASLLPPAFLHLFPQRTYKTSTAAFVRTPCVQFNQDISPVIPITLMCNHRAETKRKYPNQTRGNPTLRLTKSAFTLKKTDAPVFVRRNTTDANNPKHSPFTKCHSPANNTAQDMVLQDMPPLSACL